MRVLVAMSGGVDSTLAAALLLEQGHDVRGGTLLLCDPGTEGAAGPDPASAAAALGIPHATWDLRREFERLVVAPFLESYGAGLTPNPCVRCNAGVKFGLLLEKARQLGADRLATGHYARIGARPDGAPALLRARDLAKDQSYFLAGIRREALSRVLFPLGDLSKAEVRRLARARGLAAADRAESQEICFVGGGDAGAFVTERLAGAGEPGPVLDRNGARLGTHRGLARYTVGQRRGLGIAAGRPLYVVALHAAANAVVVGPEEELWSTELVATDLNWLAEEPGGEFRAAVRIRSRHVPAPATLAPAGAGTWRVRFERPQRAATPGQAAVLYEGEAVLGGGWIAPRPGPDAPAVVESAVR